MLLLTLAWTGCHQEEIKVYRVPKESAANANAAAPHSQGHQGTGEHVHWAKLPDGWELLPASGVRTATFAIAGSNDQKAEVAIMPFKKMGGSDLDFVNLWRTTLQMSPVEESRLAEMVEPVTIANDSGKLFDVMDPAAGGTKPENYILVAMLVRGDTSWFFKLAGNTEVVEATKPAFKEFLKTVEFHAGDEEGSTTASGAIAQVPDAVETGASPAKPAWSVPPGWQEVPPSTMLLAKFKLTGEASAAAEVTVSSFPGDVGGLLANVNRWRGQLGLPPVADADLENVVNSVDVEGGKAMLVDMTGTDAKTGQPARLLGAIVPRAGQTWFYKLLGDASVAESQKEAFLKFLQSVRYPNA